MADTGHHPCTTAKVPGLSRCLCSVGYRNRVVCIRCYMAEIGTGGVVCGLLVLPGGKLDDGLPETAAVSGLAQGQTTSAHSLLPGGE